MREPIFLAEDLPGVEQDGLAADAGKVVLDLVAVDHGVVREDLLDEHPQLGDVPLPVAQVVDEVPDGLLGRHLEGRVEALVRGEDLQVVVQHHQRLAHGLDDVLGVFPRILDVGVELHAFMRRPLERREALAQVGDLVDELGLGLLVVVHGGPSAPATVAPRSGRKSR